MTEPSPAELFDPPFELVRPRVQTAPLVFNSPHSGRVYPASFVKSSRLNAHMLRKSEDCYVDVLVSGATKLGAPLLKANFPRAYLDVNREPYELDPAMFREPLPTHVNTASVRVAGGLGTVPRVVSDSEEIYAGKISFTEAKARIRQLYFPYHRCLDALMARTRRIFNTAVLIDCHSMPSSAAQDSGEPGPRPDIVLGDRYGTTCSLALTDFLENRFTTRGYSVVRNRPYAGGHITQTYGHPGARSHAIQLEINRLLYLDQKTLRTTPDFEKLAATLTEIFGELAAALPDLVRPIQIAAE